MPAGASSATRPSFTRWRYSRGRCRASAAAWPRIWPGTACRGKVLAAIVRLLEQTLARIGNEEYAKANHSFGLTTLRHRHVRVKGQTLIFDFRAKHGIASHIDLSDRQLARIIAKCQELPGQELFQYLDPDKNLHAVGSEDVNRYLQDISGEDITAKDFRTWSATNLAALALCKLAEENAAATKVAVMTAVKAVARMLGNTPAICRKCYIHPGVIDGYLDGTLVAALARPPRGRHAAPMAYRRMRNRSGYFWRERRSPGKGAPVISRTRAATGHARSTALGRHASSATRRHRRSDHQHVRFLGPDCDAAKRRLILNPGTGEPG